jgi:hypothetical protein
MTNIISLAGLVIVFILAYSFDRWIVAFQQAAARASAIASSLWLSSIANLILVGALLLLAWFVDFRAIRSKLVSATFIVVGLLITFALALIFAIFSTLPPLGIAEYLVPTSRVVFVAAFISVVGGVGLIPRKSAISESE